MIEVTELAAAIDQKVPEISYDAFKLRQIPQMSLVGSDFPIADQSAVLDASTVGPATATPVISTQATHVAIASVDVHETANASAKVLQTLPAGTLVRVMDTDASWSLVAQDGKRLGFVSTSALLMLH